MTSLLTKEEQEELLNQKMEMMKKKNAELVKRHQVAEEDKRLAEQQGRSVTIKNPQASYSPMKGEILRAAEEQGKRKTVQNSRNQSTKKYNGPNVKVPTVKPDNNDSGPPPDPACTFLADRRREGPLPQHGRGREFSRRHPRNFGGIDFNDVPKKIHDEKGKQTHQPQIRTKADETLYTTGKERRELQEWRMEREKIDRERLERQKNKEGNWRREWDRDKDELGYAEELDDDDYDDEPLNSGTPQLTPRQDDRLKSNSRVRPQRKKDGRNESDTSAVHLVNHRTARHSNSDEPQHSNDEATRRSREKPDKLLLIEKSLPRTTDQRTGDEERRFRQVQEQNDSLIIKVKTQPSNFYRVPSNSAVNYVELGCPDNASRNRPKNGRRNIRVSSSSDGVWVSGEKAVPDLRRGEESVPYRTFKNNVNAERANSSRNANRQRRGEDHDEEPLGFSNEGSLGSPKKTQSDSKAEKHVGSGRINVHAKKRRNRNRRQRDGAFDQEQQLDRDTHTATGVANVAQNKKKIPPDGECDVKTREAGAQDSVAANEAEMKPSVSHANTQLPDQSSKNSHNKDAEVKSGELAFDKCLDGNLVGTKPDLLGKSFDLDQDPPDDDQFDDDEWEDIDEEVCIDLIAGGEEEESFEENPLDISDDTLDQLVRAHIIPPRGRKVVDWAAEMESAEGDSSGARKQTVSGLVPKSSADESQ